jgi:hypothetical protein
LLADAWKYHEPCSRSGRRGAVLLQPPTGDVPASTPLEDRTFGHGFSPSPLS